VVWQTTKTTPKRLDFITALLPMAIAGLPFSTMATAISTPNATIYVSNIDWKIRKPLLKRALYSLFSRHGKVSVLLESVVVASVGRIRRNLICDLHNTNFSHFLCRSWFDSSLAPWLDRF
jgi:hypothetical protein